ncbi:MAG: hypothetical protein LUE64_05830 [Candidatus Gastranaerophilales bacterium]|nr:hypothetical protein [Candidatus Gastranaerophilales bacterium]
MSFDIKDTIERLNELEKLALMPNEKGEVNLALAVKIEELKAKFAQMKIENENNCQLNVFVQNKRQKKLIDEI